MGPATLVSILREHDPVEAWEMVCKGQLIKPSKGGGPGMVAPPGEDDGPGKGGEVTSETPLFDASEVAAKPSDASRWAVAASRIDAVGLWEKAAESGVRVAWFGSDCYPETLVSDPNPPGVLFWRGSLSCLSRPRVAVVGTRNATPDGRAIAFELGRDLGEAGVCVVSGLALGIDGSAHHGALQAVLGDRDEKSSTQVARPLGVAASGVDVPYPRQHTGLWERVCEAGAVISETPPGQPAQAWRFPTRNRIIAALSLMVVVVESHAAGGSLITVEAALERGIEVRAVPGPVRSPASAGSNQLLYDGPGPVRNAQDVLDALGFFLASNQPSDPAFGRKQSAGRCGQKRQIDRLASTERAVLDSVGWRPSSLGRIVERSGEGVGTVAATLERLTARGLLEQQGGWWTRV